MIQTFERMRELFPVLNKRVITETMVRRVCRELATAIFYQPLSLDGYFVPAGVSLSGRQEIYINSRLSPTRQLVAAVHEIKHAAIDVASDRVLASHRCGIARRTLGAEFEAYAISSIALIPEARLVNAARGLFEPEDEFLDDLWRIRSRVHELYGSQIR